MTTATVIGRCPHPRCRAARRLTLPATRHRGPNGAEYLAPYVTGQLAGGHLDNLPMHAATQPSGGGLRGAILPLAVACVAHRRWFTWAVVDGTYDPGKPCSPACEGATGPSCSCSCGGANHGGRWAA